MYAVDPQKPTLHVQSYLIRDILDHYPDGAPANVSDIISSAAQVLLPETRAIADWNHDFLARHRSSALHVQAGLRVRDQLDPSTKEMNEKELIGTLAFDNISLPEAIAGLELLHDWSSSVEVLDNYRKGAAERWKQASRFKANHV